MPLSHLETPLKFKSGDCLSSLISESSLLVFLFIIESLRSSGNNDDFNYLYVQLSKALVYVHLEWPNITAKHSTGPGYFVCRQRCSAVPLIVMYESANEPL